MGVRCENAAADDALEKRPGRPARAANSPRELHQNRWKIVSIGRFQGTMAVNHLRSGPAEFHLAPYVLIAGSNAAAPPMAEVKAAAKIPQGNSGTNQQQKGGAVAC